MDASALVYCKAGGKAELCLCHRQASQTAVPRARYTGWACWCIYLAAKYTQQTDRAFLHYRRRLLSIIDVEHHLLHPTADACAG